MMTFNFRLKVFAGIYWFFGFAAGILLMLSLTGCGSSGSDTPGGNGNGNGGGQPPVIVNSLDISCLDVDNDQSCEAIWNAVGFFNSGSVRISGAPMPQDYLNVDLESTLDGSATVFLYSNVSIADCLDKELAFDAVLIQPGETISQSQALWGYQCGSVSYNELVITLYNAAHFNPWTYPSALDYPRDQALSNSVVKWKNTGAGG